MNRSVNPCEDFYEFTCGRWVKDHQVEATKMSWYQYKEAEKTITNNLKGKYSCLHKYDLIFKHQICF